jgi:tripartite-type tricarboxylate transporter receptor subunit TctC
MFKKAELLRATISRRRLGVVGGAAAAMLPLSSRAQAGWRPEQPITLYGPFNAGGTFDVHLRYLAERASKTLGQPIIVAPKPGAAGTLAGTLLLNAKPDGYTLGCITINSLHYPHYNKTTWDPIRDFTYIIGLAELSQGIVVAADAPWKTIEEFIEAGKKEPDKYTYGTSGIGSSGNLVGDGIDQATGAKFLHVPYKGAAEWLFALTSGQVNAVIATGFWSETVNSGKARLLAVASDERLGPYPDVPTLKERGIPVVRISPYGIIGPKDMPKSIVLALHDAFKAGTNDPSYKPMLDRFMAVPWYKSPEEFRAFFTKYFADVGPSIKRSGLSNR